MKRESWNEWDESLEEFSKTRKRHAHEIEPRQVWLELKAYRNIKENAQKLNRLLEQDQVPVDIFEEILLATDVPLITLTTEASKSMLNKLVQCERVELITILCENWYKENRIGWLKCVAHLQPGVVQPRVVPEKNKSCGKSKAECDCYMAYLIYEPIWREFCLIAQHFMKTILSELVSIGPAMIICRDYLQWPQR
jgi:hypothetical protein